MSSYRKESPFLDQMRRTIRTRHYSIRTEHAYVGCAKRFNIFHKKRRPRDMAEAEVSTFLSWLAGGPEWGGGVGRLLRHLDGPHWLPASLLYVSGLRLMECLRLRAFSSAAVML